MKNILILFIILILTSCKTIEERINDDNLTNQWYQTDSIRYQVYKTKSNRKFILILNKRKTKYIKKYIKAIDVNNRFICELSK